MHELAVCQALLTEVEHAVGARRTPVIRLVVRIGPLAGVEPRLLERAFSVARAGTLAAEAELVIEEAPVEVECLQCRAVSPAAPNRLLCARCGGWRTRLVAGDELVLQRLELRATTTPVRAGVPAALPERALV